MITVKDRIRGLCLLAKRLDFEVTNNISEYEACVCGLEALIAMGIKKAEVLGDSKLVVSQVNKEWEVREDRFKPYLEYIEDLKLRNTSMSLSLFICPERTTKWLML